MLLHPLAVDGAAGLSRAIVSSSRFNSACLTASSQVPPQKVNLQGDALFKPRSIVEIEMADRQRLELTGSNPCRSPASGGEWNQRVTFCGDDQHGGLYPMHDMDRPITEDREQDACWCCFLPDCPLRNEVAIAVSAILPCQTAHAAVTDNGNADGVSAKCASGKVEQRQPDRTR